MAEVIYKKV